MRPAPLAFAIALTLLAAPALADRIDGGWCSADGAQSVFIDGPRIVTPGGTQTTGDYTRHAFAYTVPEGEADSGQRIEMQQLSDEAAQVRLPGGLETWRRCQFTS